MQEFVKQKKRLLVQTAVWSLFLCLSLYFSGHRHWIPGFLLGVLTSIVYFLLIASRVEKLMHMDTGQAVAYMRAGWVMRLGLVVSALVVSIVVPYFEFVAAVVGLFSLQIVLYLNAVVIVAKGMFSK